METHIQVIDLSQTIRPGMIIYPGTPAPSFETACSVEQDGFCEINMQLSSHTGTHVDTPAHVIPGGRCLDGFAAGDFFGRAARLDFTAPGQSSIDTADLERYQDTIEKSEFILLHSGWSRHWGTEEYFRDYPLLTPDAAGWLTGFRLKGIGVDMISVDPVDSRELPVHHLLLESGILIVENLASLAALPPSDFLFACFPLKLHRGDASPVRAVALITAAPGTPAST